MKFHEELRPGGDSKRVKSASAVITRTSASIPGSQNGGTDAFGLDRARAYISELCNRGRAGSARGAITMSSSRGIPGRIRRLGII